MPIFDELAEESLNPAKKQRTRRPKRVPNWKRIKAYKLADAGHTQQKIADAIGVTQQCVSKFLIGRKL